MFATLIETLDSRGRGIHAYRAVAEAAFANALTDTDRAAGYYLLARLADDFVELNERMPVPSSVLDAMADRLEGAAQALDAAYAAGDDRAVLAALNAAAREATSKRNG